MNSNPLQEYFRCPTIYGNVAVNGPLSGSPGFFQFGPGLTCFGRVTSGATSHSSRSRLNDVAGQVAIRDGQVSLPFDLAELASSLRMESYSGKMSDEETRFGANLFVRKLYYWTRPIMPVSFRSTLQRIKFR